jgi:hypothetical protein
MGGWSNGVMGCWGVGVLGCWGVGVLGCWSVGVLECWSVGVCPNRAKLRAVWDVFCLGRGFGIVGFSLALR